MRLTETQEKIFSKIEASINKMGDGSIQSLDKNHAGYENFVQCVKFIMDNSIDWNSGFVLCFNSDYSKIRKDSRIQFPNKTSV